MAGQGVSASFARTYLHPHNYPASDLHGHELFLTWELSSFSTELSLLRGQGSDRTVPHQGCTGFKEEEASHSHKASGTALGAMGNVAQRQRSQTTAHNRLSQAANSLPPMPSCCLPVCVRLPQAQA